MTYDKEQYYNLLERLDPKYKAMLDDEETRYPYSVAKVKNELANNIFYIDLTVGCAISLINHLGLRTNNLHYVSLIFNHKTMFKDKSTESVDNEVQEGTKYMVVSGE